MIRHKARLSTMNQTWSPCFLGNALDNRIVSFPNQTTWRLSKKVTEKPWQGSSHEDRKKQRGEDKNELWAPSEAHAVYECIQVKGPQPDTLAIIKIRIEVPLNPEEHCDPKKRVKEASGMRLHRNTTREIATLDKLTAAGCSSSPTLLSVKIEMQTKSASYLRYPGEGMVSPSYISSSGERYWLSEGYIVYILMAKLPGQPLSYLTFWNDQLFTEHERDEVRKAFKEAFTEFKQLGIIHGDEKMENLLWDNERKKCYIIDMELSSEIKTCPAILWEEQDFFPWGLARDYSEPHW